MTTTIDQTDLQQKFTTEARAILAGFARRAQDLADSCERASRGEETTEDRERITNAYEEAQRYNSHTQGLLVERDESLWPYFTTWLYPEN